VSVYYLTLTTCSGSGQSGYGGVPAALYHPDVTAEGMSLGVCKGCFGCDIRKVRLADSGTLLQIPPRSGRLGLGKNVITSLQISRS